MDRDLHGEAGGLGVRKSGTYPLTPRNIVAINATSGWLSADRAHGPGSPNRGCDCPIAAFFSHATTSEAGEGANRTAATLRALSRTTIMDPS